MASKCIPKCSTWLKIGDLFSPSKIKNLCSEPSGEDEVSVIEVDTIMAGMINLTHTDSLAWQFQFYYPKK